MQIDQLRWVLPQQDWVRCAPHAVIPVAEERTAEKYIGQLVARPFVYVVRAGNRNRSVPICPLRSFTQGSRVTREGTTLTRHT